VTDPIVEINECRSLFLTDIQQPDYHTLKLVVMEGLPNGPAEPLPIGGAVIVDCTRIEVIDNSRVFELIWDSYVGYAVLNESFAGVDAEERYEGSRLRVYSKSHFIEFLSRATFASPEYPGPTQHYKVCCEDHIIDVISIQPPRVGKLR
jgi:hypothetical protein